MIGYGPDAKSEVVFSKAHDIAGLLCQFRERHGRFGKQIALPADEPIPMTA